jgi:FMN phosphatase YigB (HAD superfamily)
MKYLAVDLGNVICQVNFDNFNKKLSNTLNLSLDEVNYFLNRTQKLHDLGMTNMSDELRDHFQIRSPEIIDDLIDEWNKTVRADPFMLDELIRIMHPTQGIEQVKVALLSNIGKEHSSLIKNILTTDIFDHAIKFFSCDVGARKPTYIYYKTFLDMYPEFKGCVYMDDRIENIETGLLFGFKAQHFELDRIKSEQEIIDRLAKIQTLM